MKLALNVVANYDFCVRVRHSLRSVTRGDEV